MKNILLIHPDYPWPMKYPPMGIAYLASYLENRRGYTVRILDLAVESVDAGGMLKIIKDTDPLLVGISFMTCQATEAYGLAKKIKTFKPSLPIVAGGVHATALPLEAGEHFDHVIVGEGEEKLLNLADELRKTGKTKGAKETPSDSGIKNNRRSGKRAFIQDLDTLPFPAWHLLKLEKYKGLEKGLSPGMPFMIVLGSRGCPGRCTFCASHLVHGRKFRFRSPENILAELTRLKNAYNIDQFDFADDTMTISSSRIMKLCQLILKEKLDIRWACNARVNTVHSHMLKLMKQAGCIRVDFGVESGDEQILSHVKKNVTLAQIKTAHELARKAGLKTMSFFMIGLPGESPETICRTRELAREIRPDYPGLAIATPYPGTDLYDIARERGWIDGRPWNKYTTTISGKAFTPVMRTEHMTRRQILDKYREVLTEFNECGAWCDSTR